MAEKHRNVPVIPDGVPVVEVPDKLCTYAGTAMSWKGEQSFGLYAHDHETVTQDKASQYAPCKVQVHHLRTDSILFDPIARKLVNESNGYFLFAQKLSEKSSSPDFPVEMLKLSRQYRSVLRACLEGFQYEIESAPAARKQFYSQNILTFYNMELIWHLCEILFMDMMPVDVVLSQLVAWIRFHVPQVEKEANKMLAEEPLDEDSVPNYWMVIIDCLLQRRIDTVRALLKLHSQFETEPFQLAHRILRTMPVFELYGGLTAAEFQVRHGCWRAEAERLLVDGHFASHKYLSVIIKIVTGDDTVEEIIRRHCETWYQHMVASLLYTEPTVKIFDLSFHANQSMARYGGPDNMKQLDWILSATMEIDVLKVVERIHEWTEKDWLLTHLTNLLYLCGRLSVPGPQGNNFGAKVHESILLNYGTLMLSHRSLWQVGVDYLDYCPTEGRARLEALLSRVPFKTDEKALKIIQLAKDRNLGEVVYTVGKVQGMRCLSRGHLGAALTWAMRTQDTVFTAQLADIFLRKYTETGTFSSTDVLENLGSGIMLSDRLAFLGKYCELCQMVRAGDDKEAASLLVHMLVNRVPPKYFWMTLLMDALPLLDCDKQLFTSTDVFDLMSCLEELVQEAEESNLDLPADNIDRVRTALSKNLSVTLIQEGSKGDQVGHQVAIY